MLWGRRMTCSSSSSQVSLLKNQGAISNIFTWPTACRLGWIDISQNKFTGVDSKCSGGWVFMGVSGLIVWEIITADFVWASPRPRVSKLKFTMGGWAYLHPGRICTHLKHDISGRPKDKAKDKHKYKCKDRNTRSSKKIVLMYTNARWFVSTWRQRQRQNA